MSGTAISLEGSAHVVEVLQQLTRRASDLTPVMRDVGEGLVTSTQMRFETETDPTGRPWRPLSIETVLRRIAVTVRRQKKTPHGPYGEKVTFKSAYDAKGDLSKRATKRLSALKILQVLGHLKGSIHQVAGRDQVEVGSNLIYARIHQEGGKAGRGHKVTIPPRPFLGLDDGDTNMIVEKLQAYLGGLA